MDNKNNKKRPGTEVFVNSQEVSMTYNPTLDKLPMSRTERRKIEEANRRLKLKPPPEWMTDPTLPQPE